MTQKFLPLILLMVAFILVTSCKDDDEVACTESTWYQDSDGDGLGNPAISLDSCDQPTDYVSNSDDDDDAGTSVGGTNVIAQSLFNSSSLISFTTVACTLTNGSSSTCYEMVFSSNPVENGPYCPLTIDDVGGIGIYDGETNPGFQVLKKTLWDAMEADGYDIVDEDGNITIEDPGAGAGGGSAACLEAAPDDGLILTFLIPTEPEFLNSPAEIGTVENIGVSLDGIPITGDPPSVTQGPPGMNVAGGNIPSIDPCGGHMDPFGYYHLHFAPQEMDNVFDAFGIAEIACTNFPQSETALVGFAKDGFPIYASKDADGTSPSDLDACFGHTSATAEYPNGIYHYHASSTEAPNVPPCLVGAAANESFRAQ